MSDNFESSFFKSNKPSHSLQGYIKMSMFKSISELCDVVSVVIFCSADSTMLLNLEGAASEYWIPSIKVIPGSSWPTQIAKDIQEIFGIDIPLSKILRLHKLWLPNHKYPYLNHSVFEMQVSADQKRRTKSAYGKYRGKIRWFSKEEMLKFIAINNLKSPELLDFFNLIKNTPSIITNVPEYTITGNFMETTDNIVVVGRNTLFEQIIEAAKIDRNGQESLYREFLLMCYPSNYMGYQIFSRFVLELGWPKEEVPHLYRSADMYNRYGISFREFLYFIAAVEPGTSHGGGPAELRCRYIFRYLDYDKNNLLNRDEIKMLVVQVRKARKQTLEPLKVDKDIDECYKTLGVPETHSLTMSEFLRAVGELKIRGTSQIYRAPSSIQKFIKELEDRNSYIKDSGPRLSAPGALHLKGMAPYSRGTEYELAAHTVKIQKSGAAINVERLLTIENAVSNSSTRQPVLSDVSRKYSIDQFSQNSISNELLKSLRYLMQANKKLQCYTKSEQSSYIWGQLDAAVVAKRIIEVCGQAREIFLKEPRLLDMQSPVYVLGDLHGNFNDLLYFERVFWHVGPGLCPCNLLFLGDYVDRGIFSIEVISYLFSYKLQCPNKMKMLRGNHEIKRVQIQWTFEKECKLKFGDKLGPLVFNAINDAFDTMPLAAVIDGRVFCCHGGIPPPWLCPVVTAINDIPTVLNEPQDQSSLAWELMWNDPVRSKFMTEKLAMELLANEGFAVNTRRGTAHVFSTEALEKFLKSNGFSHLIRAHEVVEAGFNVQQKGKLLTVFSSSKYCGGDNHAACILADQGKLRIMRLETE